MAIVHQVAQLGDNNDTSLLTALISPHCTASKQSCVHLRPISPGGEINKLEGIELEPSTVHDNQEPVKQFPPKIKHWYEEQNGRQGSSSVYLNIPPLPRVHRDSMSSSDNSSQLVFVLPLSYPLLLRAVSVPMYSTLRNRSSKALLINREKHVLLTSTPRPPVSVHPNCFALQIVSFQ